MNSIEAYKVLGLASGSSLDGVNASIITTDGVDIFSFGRTFDIPYDENMRESLRHMQKNFVTMNDDEKLRIENALTEFHIAAAREIMFDVEGINLIGFGGHVVCHKPKEHILYQIGDGQKMANALQVKVVSKFRDADILAGGQGYSSCSRMAASSFFSRRETCTWVMPSRAAVSTWVFPAK